MAPHRSGAVRVAAAATAGLLVHLAVGTGTPRLVAGALAVATLAAAIDRLSWARAAILGAAAGVVGCSAMLWFLLRGLDLAGRGPVVAGGALALAVVAHAARFAVAAALAAAMTRRGIGPGLALGLSWVAAECVDLAPLPWSLGASTLEVPALAAIADLLGPAGAALVPCLLGGVVVDLARRRPRSAVAGLGILAAVVIYGIARTGQLEARLEEAPTVRVAAVHGVRGRSRAGAPPVDERRGAEDASAAGAALVVLPESTMVVAREEVMVDVARAAFGDLPVAIAVGVVSGGPSRNAIVVLAPGHPPVVRDKLRPFPGGEDPRGPWGWLGTPAGGVRPREAPAGDAAAGADRTPVRLAIASGTVAVATAVCWDDLFDAAGAPEADVIVVAINDGWFEGTTAGEAHLLQARLRAVAMRRPMVRATNLGATTIVDPFGRVVARADPRAGAFAIADVPLRRS